MLTRRTTVRGIAATLLLGTAACGNRATDDAPEDAGEAAAGGPPGREGKSGKMARAQGMEGKAGKAGGRAGMEGRGPRQGGADGTADAGTPDAGTPEPGAPPATGQPSTPTTGGNTWTRFGDVNAAFPMAVVSDPFPAPSKQVKTVADLDRMQGQWEGVKRSLDAYFGASTVLYRVADQAGIVGLACSLSDQGTGELLRAPFPALSKWLDYVGSRNHVGLAVVRHQDDSVWAPITVTEVETRTKTLLATPGIGSRIASLSGNEEPDNAERRKQATREPSLVADQVAAMIAGADAAGWRGEWVVPACNSWDSLGKNYAERLRREFERAGVASRFAKVGFHCYPQRNADARNLLGGGFTFLQQLWGGIPVLADQIAVTPDNTSGPARMAVWSWFVLVHHRSLGGWWPFRAGFNVGPLGNNWLVDTRDGSKSPHGAALGTFLGELQAHKASTIVPGSRVGQVSVGGRGLEFVDDERKPWRWV